MEDKKVLDIKEEEGRREEKKHYYLVIHTNAYTGNFERELIAYSFGKLEDAMSFYAPEYIKAFWNKVAGSDIDNYEQYIKLHRNYEYQSFYDDFRRSSIRFANIKQKPISEEEIADKYQTVLAGLNKQKEDTDWYHIYDECLLETMQEVDDGERVTFYNIGGYFKNDTAMCDTIYVSLRKPLPEYFEKIIIDRIKEFFSNNIYNIVRDYQWVCSFGMKHCGNDNIDYRLQNLELVDSNYNVIKTYSVES